MPYNVLVRKNSVGHNVLKFLERNPASNTHFIARKLGKHYLHIREVLMDLERKELVVSENVRRMTPLTHAFVIQREWQITAKGHEALEKLKE